jgi:hypothetical protein
MPRTSDDTLGRRRFQIQREKAVEDAVEKIRRSPDAGWDSFTNADYTVLRGLLGELWMYLERQRWEEYTFSTLTRQDILDIIALGTGEKCPSVSCAKLEEMDKILSQSRRSNPVS